MPFPPAGWYPDPAGSTSFRWWDGSTWTDALNPTPHASPPRGARPAGPATDAVSDVGAPAAGAPVGRSAAPKSPSHRRTVALVVAVTLAAVAALSVAAFFGVRHADNLGETPPPSASPPSLDPAATGSPSSEPSGSPSDHTTESEAPSGSPPAPVTLPPPSASGRMSPGPGPRRADSAPYGWINLRTGAARVGDATMTLPTDPYRITDGSVTLGPVFDVVFMSNAVVHAQFDGGQSWQSTVAMLHMPAEQVGPDPTEATQQAVQTVLARFFSGVSIRVDQPVATAVAVADKPAVRLTTKVRYHVPSLPSRYDELTIVTVPMNDGSLVAAVSSVPNDASPRQRQLAAAALASLSVG